MYENIQVAYTWEKAAAALEADQETPKMQLGSLKVGIAGSA